MDFTSLSGTWSNAVPIVDPWKGAATVPNANVARQLGVIPQLKQWGKNVLNEIPTQYVQNTQTFLNNNVKPGVFLENYLGPQGLNVRAKPALTTAGKTARFGRILGRATPYMPAIGNVLEGDPLGAASSAGGVVLGTALTAGNPIGGIIGGMVGEPVVRGGMRLAGGLMGIDPSNPLSGPDWSIPIPGGKTANDIPLTPYAKTKKSLQRAIELEKPFRDRDRKAAMEQAAFISALNTQNAMFNNQMQLLGKLYNK
tara:strand:+ start:1013 stop:1777 length:765 start_codon:yes stop_codon:yes gene_type:complete